MAEGKWITDPGGSDFLVKGKRKGYTFRYPTGTILDLISHRGQPGSYYALVLPLGSERPDVFSLGWAVAEDESSEEEAMKAVENYWMLDE